MPTAAQHGEAPSWTLKRGFPVLMFLARVGEAGASDAIAALGISRSATYRILGMLQSRRYLEINSTSGKLQLRIRSAELGMAAVSGVDVVRLSPLTYTSSSVIPWKRCFSRLRNRQGRRRCGLFWGTSA
jgi:hypothetical protein